jgi:hypothetical protein
VEEQERRVSDVAAEEDDNWRRKELIGKTLEPLEVGGLYKLNPFVTHSLRNRLVSTLAPMK